MLVIPDGLYDVAGLERAINIAVNGVPDPRARGHYYKRPSGSDFSEIADDGTTSTAIPEIKAMQGRDQSRAEQSYEQGRLAALREQTAAAEAAAQDSAAQRRIGDRPSFVFKK